MLKKIIIALLFIIVAITVGLLISKSNIGFPGIKNKEVTLIYWGLWEPENVLKPLFEEFTQKYPHIKIKYLKQSPIDYRERLQNAIAKGDGPDIFRFHNTWTPMLLNIAAPLPAKIMDSNAFKQTFYPVAVKNLTVNNKIYGLPLEIDTLALFYNEDIFQKAGVTPPKTWEELKRVANQLTVRDQNDRLVTAGVSLGTAGNVDHFSDILAVMFLQNGTDLKKIATTIGSDNHNLGEDTLKFYINFTLVDKVWDETMDRSINSFANEKVAMTFGYSWEFFEILNLNSNLRFKVMPIPQLSHKTVNLASYWVEGVSNSSKNQNEAWLFLKFLSSKESLQKFYTSASKVRLFGEPPSRVDMASDYQKDPQVAPFLSQASSATSWYFSSRTFDNGLNDKNIKYLEDGINSVLGGKEPLKALQTVEQGITQTLSQFNLQ